MSSDGSYLGGFPDLRSTKGFFFQKKVDMNNLVPDLSFEPKRQDSGTAWVASLCTLCVCEGTGKDGSNHARKEKD